MKQRADVLLVELGLAGSRAKAQALLLAGQVYLGEQRIDKPGQLLPAGTPLELRGTERFVSRGGYKLEGALQALSLSVEGRVCADLGASTGGFTDCLLQHGATRVYAVDVGRAQLGHKLACDPRVTVMDGLNARELSPELFDEPLGLVTVDVSFIGIEKLLPALERTLPSLALLLVMLKPQFEAGRQAASRGRGVISDPVVRAQALEAACAQIERHGFVLLGRTDSALAGPKGNVEHFVLAQRGAATAGA